MRSAAFFPLFLLGIAHGAIPEGTKGRIPAICRDQTSLVEAGAYHSFANKNLELLVLQLAPGLVADPGIYARLDADLTKIKSTEPAVKDVQYLAKTDPHSLNIYFKDPRDLQRAAKGDFIQWRCLNSFFHVRVQEPPRLGAIVLHFPGAYNPNVLKGLYESIPGIQKAEFDVLIGDGSNVYVTRKGATWVYLLDVAGGDCPSGCTEHEFFLFEVNTGSRISRREKWKAVVGAEPPEWVTTYFRRYQ